MTGPETGRAPLTFGKADSLTSVRAAVPCHVAGARGGGFRIHGRGLYGPTGLPRIGPPVTEPRTTHGSSSLPDVAGPAGGAWPQAAIATMQPAAASTASRRAQFLVSDDVRMISLLSEYLRLPAQGSGPDDSRPSTDTAAGRPRPWHRLHAAAHECTLGVARSPSGRERFAPWDGPAALMATACGKCPEPDSWCRRDRGGSSPCSCRHLPGSPR